VPLELAEYESGRLVKLNNKSIEKNRLDLHKEDLTGAKFTIEQDLGEAGLPPTSILCVFQKKERKI
jgi:hypothetical protein